MRAYCDFDGTISIKDVTDIVLERFALPQWHDLEDAWTQGKITSAECMRSQIALIEATPQELNALLDTIEIDAGFIDFVSFCRENAIEVTVVSDGVDRFIHRVLENYGLSDIEVIANRLSYTVTAQKFQYRLDTPFASAGCAAGSGVCKCKIVDLGSDHLYVGDGQSDFCVSRETRLVFAKKKLAAYCERQSIPFIPYQGFSDVQFAVEGLLKDPSRRTIDARLAKTA